MKAYRLEANKDIELVNNTWLYDVDEDFTSKVKYKERAKKLTAIANKEFNTNYTWVELFGEPVYVGWFYCPSCGDFHWSGDDCE